MLAVLRVVPGGSAPPVPSAARRDGGVARSGRESRCAGRTGKLDFRYCRLDNRIALWVECDGGDRRPVSGLPAPAPWVAFARTLRQRVARGEQQGLLRRLAL